MTSEESKTSIADIIENSRVIYEKVDENNAIITNQYVTLTKENYAKIKEDLEVLNALRPFIMQGKDCYGNGSWGWVEFDLDLCEELIKEDKEDNKRRKLIQRWLEK